MMTMTGEQSQRSYDEVNLNKPTRGADRFTPHFKKRNELTNSRIMRLFVYLEFVVS
jgi:hypothetical protein